MGADNYAALAALPALDAPPAAPPLLLAELMERIPTGRPLDLARCILLGDDLLLREAVLSGEVEAAEPAVLTPEQLAGTAPLPDPLADPSATAMEPTVPTLPADVTWSAYFRYAADLAVRRRSRFLLAWVRAEVSLRNALATVRARALGLDPSLYRVASELEEGSPDTDAAVAGWSAAADPLEGMRVLLAARWRWVELHEPWFSFDDDELAAYAAKLVLLHRWRRTAVRAKEVSA